MNERFPIFPHQILVFAAFAVNFAALNFIFSHSQWNWKYFALGGVTFVLLSLLMRVADDIKDFRADGTYFPDRPSQNGKVRESDLTAFLYFLFAAILAAHLALASSPVVTAILLTLVFSFLLYKWLFLESVIRPNLILAFVTHNPIVLFFQYYTLSFFLDSEYSGLALWFLLGDALITSAWEISRKIRGRNSENEYNTYSKILGTRLSSFLVILLIGAAWTLTFVSVFRTSSFYWGWLLPAAVLGFLLFNILRFWKPG